MELRLPTARELTTAYRRDLKAAFPAEELAPLSSLRRAIGKGTYRPWCLFDGDELVGEAFAYLPAPGFVLFDYLCVTAARRNAGLGAALVARLLAAERGSVVFGEAEIPAYAPDPALAARRLAFYRRCGARQAGYDMALFGALFHTLYWADAPLADDALRTVHERAWRQRLPGFVYRRQVVIPWERAMGRPKKFAWSEGTDEDPGV